MYINLMYRISSIKHPDVYLLAEFVNLVLIQGRGLLEASIYFTH